MKNDTEAEYPSQHFLTSQVQMYNTPQGALDNKKHEWLWLGWRMRLAARAFLMTWFIWFPKKSLSCTHWIPMKCVWLWVAQAVKIQPWTETVLLVSGLRQEDQYYRSLRKYGCVYLCNTTWDSVVNNCLCPPCSCHPTPISLSHLLPLSPFCLSFFHFHTFSSPSALICTHFFNFHSVSND